MHAHANGDMLLRVQRKACGEETQGCAGQCSEQGYMCSGPGAPARSNIIALNGHNLADIDYDYL